MDRKEDKERKGRRKERKKGGRQRKGGKKGWVVKGKEGWREIMIVPLENLLYLHS